MARQLLAVRGRRTHRRGDCRLAGHSSGDSANPPGSCTQGARRPCGGAASERRAVMRRFRDVHDLDDPVVAELAGMLRAVADLDPPLGAEVRVRAALSRRGAPRPSWWPRAVVMLLLVVAIPAAVVGVNLLIRLPPQTAVPAADRSTPAAAHDRAYPVTKVSPMAPVSPAPEQDAPSPGVAHAVPAPSTLEVDRSPARRAAPDEPSTRSSPAGRRTETHPNEYSRPVTRSPETPVESPVELPRLATRAPDENHADPTSIRSDEANLVHLSLIHISEPTRLL